MGNFVNQVKEVIGWLIVEGINKIDIEISGYNREVEVTHLQFINIQGNKIDWVSDRNYEKVMQTVVGFSIHLLDDMFPQWSIGYGGCGSLAVDLTTLLANVSMKIYTFSELDYDLIQLVETDQDKVKLVKDFAQEVVNLIGADYGRFKVSFSESSCMWNASDGLKELMQEKYYNPTDERILLMLEWAEESLFSQVKNREDIDNYCVNHIYVSCDYDYDEIDVEVGVKLTHPRYLEREIDLASLLKDGEHGGSDN